VVTCLVVLVLLPVLSELSLAIHLQANAHLDLLFKTFMRIVMRRLPLALRFSSNYCFLSDLILMPTCPAPLLSLLARCLSTGRTDRRVTPWGYPWQLQGDSRICVRVRLR
jgi:hypothetical protein